MILADLKKSIFSRLSVLCITITLLWTCLNIKEWRKEHFIGGDGFSYYAYLPALVICGDIKLQFLDTIKESYFSNLWFSRSADGTRLTKMGAGVALLQSPFFLTAHFFAKRAGYIADGFSIPYKFSLCISCLFYAVAGFKILRLVLLRFFPDKVVAATLLSIGLGTNLLCYATLEPLMSHSYSFFLFSLLLYFTIRWHEKPGYKMAALLGTSAGLIALTRLPNSIVLIVPLLYGVNGVQDLKKKMSFFLEKKFQIMLMLLCALLAFFPQLLYWKTISGQWFYYSYQDENFFFSHPHLTEGLLGYRKGWLVYTPLMFFALAGILTLREKLKSFFLPLIIFLLLDIYIVLSWWCWWYGGSFGLRAFIETYALLALPFAGFISYVSGKKLFLRWCLYLLVSFTVVLNLFQTYQYKREIISYDAMTEKAYWSVFGKLTYPEHFNDMQQRPDYDNAKLGLEEKKIE